MSNEATVQTTSRIPLDFSELTNCWKTPGRPLLALLTLENLLYAYRFRTFAVAITRLAAGFCLALAPADPDAIPINRLKVGHSR